VDVFQLTASVDKWSASKSPRLQSKIPKCFGFQLHPGHEWYLWHDDNITLNDGAEEYIFDPKADLVVFRHPGRDTIEWEHRYNWRALFNNKPSRYMQTRYLGEIQREQEHAVFEDKGYVDDLLVNGGVFLYRNTKEVQLMLKEWWYHISRYNLNDQLSFAYVLKQSGLKVKILPDDITDCKWFTVKGHK
jgi:hypothetical protein